MSAAGVMAGQPEDLVTVCTDATDGGTLVRVVAPCRHIRMVDLMPVFEALDLNLVSYTAEPDPDAVGIGATGSSQAPLGRRKHSFRGRFLVTDADGDNLSDALVDGLVAALQEALHVRLSRPGRPGALNEESRRGSVASYATDASMDPDSPSFHANAANPGRHGPSSSGTRHGSSHALSNLNPNAGSQCFSTHHNLHQHNHYQQHQQYYYPYPYPQNHHEHAASAGSMPLSDHSVSSISSLLRVPSAAASDPPTVPSPPANARSEHMDFSLLQQQQQQQQQQGEPVFLDPAQQLAVPTVAALVAANGSNGEDRYSGGPTTPFCAAYHHSHTRSQPPSQPPSQGSDMYDVAMAMPQRASSACSTTPNASGPLVMLNGSSSPGQDPAAAADPSGAAPSGGPPSAPALGPAPASGRAPHVSFFEPPQTSTSAAMSASTSAAATSATTPMHSRPPSSSASFLCTGMGGAGYGLASHVGAACMVDMPSGGPSGSESGISTVAGARAGAAPGDDSPASSSDERDGSYTWWSTFTAQDTVARIMSHPARSISAEADLGQAKSLMTKYNISALLVNTGTVSPGFITKRDFLKVQFSKNFKRTKVKDVMTQPVIFVNINLPIEHCSRVLELHGVRRVLVHDPSRVSDTDPLSAFVGVVSDADLFKCMGAPALSPVLGSVVYVPEDLAGIQLPGFGAIPYVESELPLLPPLPTLLPPTATGGSQAPIDASSQRQVQPPHPGLQQQAQTHTQTLPELYPPEQQSILQLQTLQQQAAAVQLQQQQQPAVLSSTVGLSSTASTTTPSVNGSAGPSHAASMATSLPKAEPSATATAAAAVAAALSLAAAGSGGSAVMRLNAEASLADRYRCAAALWELDFNELEVTRRIGEGSFGEVVLANFRGTKVAVKRLRGFDMGPDNPDGGPGETGPSPTQMPIFRQFFEREIEILATIRHPNVVNFIGACHTPPNVCLVTEFCARGSLDHLLHKSSTSLDLLKKVEFSMDIARGMSCLHSQKPPIIHRDLKTANLLVSARFEVKVADFGLSRIKDHAQLINSRAGLEGTVEYAAPEVLRGEPFTEKCDIWSYAVLLWEIIHRQRPYADADVPIYILMMSLGNGSLRLPPVREELATPGLARLVDRCMAWHPAERPSFREVLHALEAEYKILRGKAAAVPRSDSASSMMVLPGGQKRPSAADGGSGAAQPHAHTHQQQQQQRPLPHQPPHSAVANDQGVRVLLPNPQESPGRPGAPQRKSSKLGLAPGNPGHTEGVGSAGYRGTTHADASGGASPFAKDTGNGAFLDEQQQKQQQHQSIRPRVKLAVPVQQGAGGCGGVGHALLGAPGGGGGGGGGPEAPDPISPTDSSSRPSSSRVAGGGGSMASRSGAGGGKPGAPGRPGGSRSLRSAARSKSMPLPEFEWFGGEEGSEEYLDTTDSVADEDGDAAASTETTASGAAAGAATATARAAHPHLYGPLGGDRGGVRSTTFPDGALLRSGKANDSTEVAAADLEMAATAAVVELLPQHLLVRVPRPEEGSVGAGGGPIGSPAAMRVRTSAFASAVQDTVRNNRISRDGEEQGGVSSWQVGRPLAAGAGAEAAADGLSDVRTATSTSPPMTTTTMTTATTAATSVTAFRQSPFHLAASSPFAEAADAPWSPPVSEEADQLPTCFSSQAATRTTTGSPQEAPPQEAATPAAAGSASQAAPVTAPAPPRRVAFVSPFAQLANEAPLSLSRDDDESSSRCHSAEEEADVAQEPWRRVLAAAGDLTTSSGAPNGAAGAAARPTGLASTANSTDVNTTAEKDQRSSLDGACWGVLNVCSKPPSGDVYASGAASRLSPNARPASPATLAAAYAHATTLPPVVLAGHDRAAGRRAERGVSISASATTTMSGEGSVSVSSASGAAAAVEEAEEQQRLVASASAGLESLALDLPGVMAFSGQGLAGVSADSDQFDDDDEDTTLHTTAWVRL